MIPQYLAVTSLLMLLPLSFFANKSKKPLEEKILAGFLLISACLSSTFWINPVQKSTIHYYDRIIAKISIFLFSLYILFVKEIAVQWKVLYLLIYSVGLFIFYKSNSYSSKQWCSEKHIFCHVIFHIFIIYGAMIAFF
jgi:predicted membrane channel-forming protein YqfA (hemolysin III family)